MDVGEAFFVINRGNIKLTDINLEFSQSGSDAGQYTYVVADSKCDLVISLLHHIYVLYLQVNLRPSRPGGQGRCLVEPWGKRVRLDLP